MSQHGYDDRQTVDIDSSVGLVVITAADGPETAAPVPFRASSFGRPSSIHSTSFAFGTNPHHPQSGREPDFGTRQYCDGGNSGVNGKAGNLQTSGKVRRTGMRFKLKHEVPRLFGAVFMAIAAIGLMLPQIAGAADDVDEMVEFFDTMPDGMFTQLAPDGWAGADANLNMSAVMVEFLPFPAPTRVIPVITAAELNGNPVITFKVLNEFGLGIEDLIGSASFSFTASKLVPGTGGRTDAWSTYILSDDEGVPDISATTYNRGTLEEIGGGEYRFTFDDELQEIAGVVFEPELTHRVTMQLSGVNIGGNSIPGNDTAFDVQPSTGATTGIVIREIITQEACASCHGTEDFAFHGGNRRDVRACVACHQDGKIDAFDNNSINFGVMLHKIHTGANLNNLPLLFCGFPCETRGAPPDDFSDIHFPQSTANCVVCHDPANPETPQAINIANAPTAETCASCHDDLAFDETGLTNANRNHVGLAQPNSTCAACHSENGLMVSSLEEHRLLAVEAAQTFQYNILAIENTGEGESPVVTFSITDPTNGDAPYDLTSDPEFTSGPSSINVLFSWPNRDFSNVGNDDGTDIVGGVGARAATISVVNSSGLRDYVIDNGDGTYTLDTLMIPTPVVIPAVPGGLGSGTVAMDGHPAGDLSGDVGSFDDRVPVTNVTRAFAITDTAPEARRMVVDVAKCQDCHGVNDGLSLHGGNRTDNTQHCASCHNGNATDVNRRPFDPDGIADNFNEAALDGKEDQSIDFKHMIHAIHAAGMRENAYVAYGFGGPFDGSEVHYPRSPADCQACHVAGTYEVPLGEGVLGSTVNTGATRIANNQFAPSVAVARDPSDDNKLSPEGSVCSACHDSEVAIDHMSIRSTSFISFGNAFLDNPDPILDPDTQAELDMAGPENCSFCHGPGRFAEAHGGGN
jgi:OmcA/MtrC family decaheme c-type cytochrome